MFFFEGVRTAKNDKFHRNYPLMLYGRMTIGFVPLPMRIKNKIQQTKMKTLVLFGSTTGTTESVARMIAGKLAAEVLNIADAKSSQIAAAERLVLGSSTWGLGELQDDWYDGIDKLKQTDLANKTIAIFGVGDSVGYSDTFCGAMAELYKAVKDSGARLVGAVSTEGYSFDASEAVVDGQFVGLALDEDNESNRTEERINDWLKTI